MPKVSVVVPVYNVEKYLARCVNSLLNQTLQDIEIILVDDGSKDSSPVICDELAVANKRVKCIHIENGGAAHARIVGIGMATGEYIGFMDSDDWADLNMYKVMYDECVRSDVDIIQCGFCRVTDESKLEVNSKTDTLKIYEAREAINQLYGVSTSNEFNYLIWNKLYKHDLFIGLDLPDNIRGIDDVPFIPRAFFGAKNIAVINNPFVYYFSRQDDNNKSTMDMIYQDESQLIDSHIDAFNSVSEYFIDKDKDLYMLSLRHTLTWCLSAIKRIHIDKGIKRKAVEIIRKSNVIRNPYLPFEKKIICLIVKILPL